MDGIWLGAVGLGLGAVVGYLVASLRLGARLAAAEAALKAEREKGAWTEEAKLTLAEAVRALTEKNLDRAQRQLLDETRTLLEQVQHRLSGQLGTHKAELETLVDPLKTALSKLERELGEVERRREGAYQALRQQLELLSQESRRLAETAGALKEALKSSTARGHWGELQLRRLVELAGMTRHVDFAEQVGTDAGRPDLVVFLPNGGRLAVDAKAPMQAYLKALSTPDEKARKELLKAHARALKSRIQELAAKDYARALDPGPDFTVVFVPSESALAAAFEADPALLDEAIAARVLPASPLSLLALLKSVAYGWQQVRLGEEARRLAEDARRVLERLAVFRGHLGQLGRGLEKSLEAYNKAVGSYKHRLMPLERALAERLGEPEGDVSLSEIEGRPRSLPDQGESSK